MCSRARVTCGANLRGSGGNPARISACSILSRRAASSGAALDPDPKIARLAAAAENPGAGELQGEPAGPQPRQRLVDIGGPILADLADKAQGQMEIAGVDPFRAVDAGAQQRQMQLQLGRKPDPDKQPQHRVT